MTKRKFKINIPGRVRKVNTTNFVTALYEAVSNSIHAIQSTRASGSIDIELIRAPRQPDLLRATGEVIPITAFVVSDTGIGFNKENMESFCEADSEFKASIGGKGIGRFTWLKFFERADIESVFQEGEKRIRRTFSFSSNGVDESKVAEVRSKPSTVVRLDPLIKVYESKSRQTLEEICTDLVEHFIAYFVTGGMPKLIVRDGAAVQNMQAFYHDSIGKGAESHEFTINGTAFKATSLKFYLGGGKHCGLLCGNDRVADKILLDKSDPFFSKRFTDENLKTYALQVFVQSPYLDKLVHDDRDGFRFPEPGTFDAASPGAVSKDEVAQQVLSIARQVLGAEIEKLKESNVEAVTSYVSAEAPQYRFLIGKHRSEIENIHSTDKGQIDLSLRRIQFNEEVKTRTEIGELLKKADELDGFGKDEWAAKVAEIFVKVSEQGKAKLASYIAGRKLLLDLLQKQTEVSEQHYAREQAVHKLIFPMQTTSDDVSYEEQNLWILDERLSYHYYLASDKALRTMPPAESESKKEPDIIVFNRPIALNDRPETERLESIVIVEFKRPGQSSVDGEKNPVQQIQEYIELILEGRAENRKGRPLMATPSTYFFGYAICELDSRLKTVLRRLTMKETPDGRGMFGFFPDHRAYIEVISYEKMIDDAKKRNRILFDKLQLPVG